MSHLRPKSHRVRGGLLSAALFAGATGACSAEQISTPETFAPPATSKAGDVLASEEQAANIFYTLGDMAYGEARKSLHGQNQLKRDEGTYAESASFSRKEGTLGYHLRITGNFFFIPSSDEEVARELEESPAAITCISLFIDKQDPAAPTDTVENRLAVCRHFPRGPISISQASIDYQTGLDSSTETNPPVYPLTSEVADDVAQAYPGLLNRIAGQSNP